MIRSLLSFLGLVAAIAFGFGIWLFLLRGDDRLPGNADAVVVLAGSDVRLPVALRLIHAGVSKTLVVSADAAASDPDRDALCHGPKPTGYKLVCQVADPFSTRGEARMIAGLVTKNRWRSVVVVTSRYHLYRSDILIRRCTKIDVALRGTDADTWWRKALAIPLEYAKLIRAETFQRGC